MGPVCHVFHHIVTITLDRIVSTMTFNTIVTFDSIVAFIIGIGIQRTANGGSGQQLSRDDSSDGRC
jgi:hypothetical protein